MVNLSGASQSVSVLALIPTAKARKAWQGGDVANLDNEVKLLSVTLSKDNAS